MVQETLEAANPDLTRKVQSLAAASRSLIAERLVEMPTRWIVTLGDSAAVLATGMARAIEDQLADGAVKIEALCELVQSSDMASGLFETFVDLKQVFPIFAKIEAKIALDEEALKTLKAVETSSLVSCRRTAISAGCIAAALRPLEATECRKKVVAAAKKPLKQEDTIDARIDLLIAKALELGSSGKLQGLVNLSAAKNTEG